MEELVLKKFVVGDPFWGITELHWLF